MREVTPRESVGGLEFGMSRADTRQLLGGRHEAFRRAPHSPTASDHYPDEGLFLNFGLDDRLFSVEMARWADPSLRGVRLLGRGTGEVLSDLEAVGVVAERSEDGWALPELGLALGEVSEGAFGSLLASRAAVTSSEIDFFDGGTPRLEPDAELPVVPGRGFAGGLELGASRDQLRSLLGPGLAGVPDTGGAAQDNFLEVDVAVLYDDAGTAVRLTASGPTRPSVDGMPLLGRTWSEVVRDAAARGIPVVEREAELLFPGAGCLAWPLRGGPDAPLAAVSLPG